MVDNINGPIILNAFRNLSDEPVQLAVSLNKMFDLISRAIAAL